MHTIMLTVIEKDKVGKNYASSETCRGRSFLALPAFCSPQALLGLWQHRSILLPSSHGLLLCLCPFSSFHKDTSYTGRGLTLIQYDLNLSTSTRA